MVPATIEEEEDWGNTRLRYWPNVGRFPPFPSHGQTLTTKLSVVAMAAARAAIVVRLWHGDPNVSFGQWEYNMTGYPPPPPR